jgi:hypothetical protein
MLAQIFSKMYLRKIYMSFLLKKIIDVNKKHRMPKQTRDKHTNTQTKTQRPKSKKMQSNTNYSRGPWIVVMKYNSSNSTYAI